MLDRKYTGFHVLLVCLILLGVPWKAVMGQEHGPGSKSGGNSVTKETCIFFVPGDPVVCLSVRTSRPG